MDESDSGGDCSFPICGPRKQFGKMNEISSEINLDDANIFSKKEQYQLQ